MAPRKRPEASEDISQDELEAMFVGAPYQPGSATSLAGAASVAPRVRGQNHACYRFLEASPGNSDEGVYCALSSAHGWKEDSVRRSMVALRQAGLIEPCCEVTNVGGDPAVAYRTCRPYPVDGVVPAGPGALAQARARITLLEARITLLETFIRANGVGGFEAATPVDAPFSDDPEDYR